jgi:hypothetical protein
MDIRQPGKYLLLDFAAREVLAAETLEYARCDVFING